MSHHQHRLRIRKGRGACGPDAPFAIIDVRCGAVAHLGERFNGIEEVEGSIPSSSTTTFAPLYFKERPVLLLPLSGA